MFKQCPCLKTFISMSQAIQRLQKLLQVDTPWKAHILYRFVKNIFPLDESFNSELLDSQHSAENLRQSMQKYFQSKHDHLKKTSQQFIGTKYTNSIAQSKMVRRVYLGLKVEPAEVRIWNCWLLNDNVCLLTLRCLISQGMWLPGHQGLRCFHSKILHRQTEVALCGVLRTSGLKILHNYPQGIVSTAPSSSCSRK